MDVRSHLHDAEVLLCSQRSTVALLLLSWGRGFIEGIIVGTIVSLIIAGISFFALGVTAPIWVYVGVTLLGIIGVCAQRWRVWNQSFFRITSERILLQEPFGLFHTPLRTIKWPQYQESFMCCAHGESSFSKVPRHVQHLWNRHFFDYFFRSWPLCIRFGTADAQNEICFPSLRYSPDLKHYLDKVDSAVRRNDLASVKPFIAKPRGKRDSELTIENVR